MARWVRWNNPTIKPPFGVQIDWSNPITEGLVGCWLFNELSSNPINLVDNYIAKLENNARWNSDGILCLSNDGKTSCINFGTYLDLYPNLSIIANFKWFGDSGYHCIVLCKKDSWSSSDMRWQYTFNTSSNDLRWERQGKTTSNSSIWPINKRFTTCLIHIDGFPAKLYENGKYKSDFSGTLTFGTDKNAKVFVGDFNGILYRLFLYNRAINEKEVEQLHYEPYSFFLYPQYWYLVDFGGTGATKVSSDFTALFDIFAKVQSGLTVLFDVYEKVQSDLTNIFSIYNIVQSNLTCIFDVNGRVQSDIIALFDIGGRVSSEVTLTFDVLNRIGSNLTGIFKILNKTQSDLGGVFDIYNLVQSEFTALFDVYNLTNSEITILYDMAGRVKSDLELLFNILANIDKSKWPWDMLPWNKLPWGKSPWKEG